MASVRTSTEIANEIGGNISNIKQAVQQITWQVFKTSNQDDTTSVIDQISSQLKINPKGTISRSIWRFAQQLEKGIEIDITQISPPPERAIENFNIVILVDATNNQNAAMDILRASQSIADGNQQTSHFSQSSCSGNSCKSLGVTNTVYIDRNKVNKLTNPVYELDTIQSTRSIASWFHGDAFTTERLASNMGSTWYYGGNNIRNNIVPVAFNDPITVSQIEDVFRQIVIETAIKGSQSSADRSLTQIVQEVTNDPTGSVSKSIFSIAQLQASGDISAANNAIDKIALHLAAGGSAIEIPTIVGDLVILQQGGTSSSNYSNGELHHRHKNIEKTSEPEQKKNEKPAKPEQFKQPEDCEDCGDEPEEPAKPEEKQVP
jgi:hypothetical protein